MSKPNLYQEPGNNNLISVHDFAYLNKISIRKARRMIARMIKDGKLTVFRDMHRDN